MSNTKSFDIQTVNVSPNDVILFHVNEDCDLSEVAAIQKEMEQIFPNNTVLVANELILKRITLFKAENMITAYQIVDEIGKQINANDLNGITGTYTGTSVYDILY